MLYVEQSLSPNEEILIAARFHWMYTLQAVMWILFGLAIGIGIGYAGIWWVVSEKIRTFYPGLPPEMFEQAWDNVVQQEGGYLKILWGLPKMLRFSILGSFVIGIYFFAHMMIIKATTEIAITSERLVYKKGLIARHVGELNIDRIEGVSVRQGVLGRIFGYGRVIVRGMGVGEVMLPIIEDPIALRGAIQQSLSMQNKGGNMKSSDEF